MCNGIVLMRLKKKFLVCVMLAIWDSLFVYHVLIPWCYYIDWVSFKQDVSRGQAGEEQGLSNMNVMCRLCFFGENEGSEKARRMLPCKKCGKKYHRSCLKSWAQHRGKIYWPKVYMTLEATCILICGTWLQIYFTGVHGSVPLVGFVR